MLGAVALGAGIGSGAGGGVVDVLSLPDDPPQAVTVIAISRQASLLEDLLFIVVAALKSLRE